MSHQVEIGSGSAITPWGSPLPPPLSLGPGRGGQLTSKAVADAVDTAV